MKQNEKISRLAGIQSVEPKTAAAVILVALMAVLWGRALLRSKAGPSAAKAQSVSQQTVEPQQSESVQIEPVRLPMIAGRHDTLAADIFTPARWKAFEWDVSLEQNIPSALVDPNELIRQGQFKQARIVEALTKGCVLEAIIAGSEGNAAKVCINGRVLSVGQALQIECAGEAYSLLVDSIEKNQVVLTWNNHAVTLQMPVIGTGM